MESKTSFEFSLCKLQTVEDKRHPSMPPKSTTDQDEKQLATSARR